MDLAKCCSGSRSYFLLSLQSPAGSGLELPISMVPDMSPSLHSVVSCSFEVGLAGVGWRDGEKMQTIVTE